MKPVWDKKVIVITGAARGIGEALAHEFLRQGATVIALDRDWNETTSAYHDFMRAGAVPISCDITKDEQVDLAYKLAIDRFGTVDVLFNNAAMRQRDLYPLTGASSVLETKDSHWHAMIQVNLMGTLKVIRRFIQPMLHNQTGSIINVSANGSLTHVLSEGVSVGNHPGLMNQPYDATKAALTSLSFYLAEEVKASNVAVNVVFPGPTRTTGSEDLSEGRKSLGLNMTLLDASHVLPICLRLAAETGSGITGQAFDVVLWNSANAVHNRLAE